VSVKSASLFTLTDLGVEPLQPMPTNVLLANVTTMPEGVDSIWNFINSREVSLVEFA